MPSPWYCSPYTRARPSAPSDSPSFPPSSVAAPPPPSPSSAAASLPLPAPPPPLSHPEPPNPSRIPRRLPPSLSNPAPLPPLSHPTPPPSLSHPVAPPPSVSLNTGARTDYGEIFGCCESGDFAVPYEDLFAQGSRRRRRSPPRQAAAPSSSALLLALSASSSGLFLITFGGSGWSVCLTPALLCGFDGMCNSIRIILSPYNDYSMDENENSLLFRCIYGLASLDKYQFFSAGKNLEPPRSETEKHIADLRNEIANFGLKQQHVLVLCSLGRSSLLFFCKWIRSAWLVSKQGIFYFWRSLTW